MNNDLVIKKCLKCGAIVLPIKDCNCDNCGVKCCNEEMVMVKANSTDAVIEKHIPSYKRIDDELYITVNHVMEKEHYIEWIALVKDDNVLINKLYPEQGAECIFKYIPGATIYAFCNKHGLWKSDVVK